MGRIMNTDLASRIIEDYVSGLTISQLAKKYHRRRETISPILHNAGVIERSARNPVTMSEKTEIWRLRREGASSDDLSRQFRMAKATMTKILAEAGLQDAIGRPRTTWMDDRRAEVVEMYESGLSQREVAERLGTSQAMVSKILRAAGVEVRTSQTRVAGDQHGNWKGGRSIDSNGYVVVLPADEDLRFVYGHKKAYVREHRLVMGRLLGRPVRPDESVHHKDGNRQNNDPSNLQLRQGRHGKGAAFTCLDCGSHNIQAVELG